MIRARRHPARPPRSHVQLVPRPARVYNWQVEDEELCGEADATCPHGIERPEAG